MFQWHGAKFLPSMCSVMCLRQAREEGPAPRTHKVATVKPS